MSQGTVIQGTVTRVLGFQIRARTTLIPETAWANPMAAAEPPAIGDPVWLLFENGDTNHPVWSPTVITVPEPAEGTGDKHYVFSQGTASDTWVIEHDLNKRPSVTIEDSSGNTVEGELTYSTLNIVTVTFSAPISGTAYLN